MHVDWFLKKLLGCVGAKRGEASGEARGRGQVKHLALQTPFALRINTPVSMQMTV